MAGAAAVLAAATLATLAVPASPAAPAVAVDPKELTTLPNSNITILCNVGIQIFYCRFVVPGIPTRILQPGLKPDEYGVSYYGSGLETGQCGIKIDRIQNIHNGIVNCTMGSSKFSHELEGSSFLTVAQSPNAPELQVDTGRRGSHDYYEGDQLKALCKIANGRPVANISWYLGDYPLRDGLSRPPLIEVSSTDTYTISQNLTRTLSWSDNGKALRCVSSHIAMKPGADQSLLQLNVEFPPKPTQQSFGVEQHDLETGVGRSVLLEICANPKPNIKWRLGNGEEVREERTDSSGNFEVGRTEDKGSGKWQTKLKIVAVDDEILKADYQVIATNIHGEEIYHVSLTSSGLGDVMKMGSGVIIGIVIAVLLILVIIFLVIFARATGRWCFAVRGSKASHSGSEAHIDPHGTMGTTTSTSPGKDGLFEGIQGKNTEVAGEGGVVGPGALGASSEYVNGSGGVVNQEDQRIAAEKIKDDKDTPLLLRSGQPARNEKESESLTAPALERELNVGEVDSGYLPTNCMVANGAQTNERSDTESADQGPLSNQKKKSSAFQFPKFFKKKDKVSADPDSLTQEAQLQDHEATLTEKKGINNECMKAPDDNPDRIVYAELDLQAGRRQVVVRSEDEKTEYAEIMHNPKREDEPPSSTTQ